MEDGGY
ncbi:512c8ea5-f074-4055-b98e-bd875c9a6ec1 [Thermothielavioides terrestris]|nr:512c8ea5-f074-4055-b98e-bd875c9a6ec1 [Thermothielavioides terrestris]